jgi:hypothetical protein
MLGSKAGNWGVHTLEHANKYTLEHASWGVHTLEHANKYTPFGRCPPSVKSIKN